MIKEISTMWKLRYLFDSIRECQLDSAMQGGLNIALDILTSNLQMHPALHLTIMYWLKERPPKNWSYLGFSPNF